jgi:23S rRNA U2552 (ribose-2'-O)-methylase RlmE/FtsJ
MASVVVKPPWELIQFYKNKKDVETSFFVKPILGSITYESKDDEKELYELRNKIDIYESKGSAMWEYYKKIVNPYELVYTQPKYKELPQSVCLLNPLSRSYFKIIEILNVTNFFETHGTSILRSAHVCEGPGGFIEGFYDECEKRRLVVKSANAITLKPQQANVPGWKRASNFLQKHRSIQIHYGADNTGDILKVENQDSFISTCPKVLLFTGDGGFDFSTNYSQQESAIFPLLIASVRIGFEVMHTGAYFILKFFDIHHKATADLLYFLSLHFKQWTLYKPATSRPCNPEHYFVGIEFKGCNAPMLEYLRGWCSLSNIIQLSSEELPEEFAHTIEEIRANAVKSQVEYLKTVFSIIESEDKISMTYPNSKLYEVMSYDWCKLFNVPVHPSRALLIEALRSDLRASGQL